MLEYGSWNSKWTLNWNFGSTQKPTLSRTLTILLYPKTRIFLNSAKYHTLIKDMGSKSYPNPVFIVGKNIPLPRIFISLKKHTLFLDFCCFWHRKHDLRGTCRPLKNYPFYFRVFVLEHDINLRIQVAPWDLYSYTWSIKLKCGHWIWNVFVHLSVIERWTLFLKCKIQYFHKNTQL